MAEDVLQTLASAAGLAGILVVTADPAAAKQEPEQKVLRAA